ncbi:MAG: hypothetical protein WD530_00605, partial [Vicingaceae bacterium]
QSTEFSYLPLAELWEMIQEVQPVKGIKYGKEAIFSKWIFIILLITGVYLLIIRLKKIKAPLQKNILTWGLISAISLIAFFIAPDSSQKMGFVSSRLVLFFFLFYIIFLATQKIPSWLKIIGFLLINYVNIALLKVYYQNAQENQTVVNELSQAAQKIEIHGVVLPINTTDNLQFAHISNYLGVEKPLIITENYEATLNYFPLKWKNEEILQIPHLEGGKKIIEVIQSNQLLEQINYIFIMQNKTSSDSSPEYLKSIEQSIQLIYRNETNSILLYKISH